MEFFMAKNEIVAGEEGKMLNHLEKFAEELNNKLEDLGYNRLEGEDEPLDYMLGLRSTYVMDHLWPQLIAELECLEEQAQTSDVLFTKYEGGYTVQEMFEFCKARQYPYAAVDGSYRWMFLTDFLVSELHDCILLQKQVENSKPPTSGQDIVTLGKELEGFSTALGLPLRSNITSEEELLETTRECCAKFSSLLESKKAKKLLNRSDFSDEDLKKLSEIDVQLQEDYKLRKEVMLKRCDITLQSMMYSEEHANGKEADIIATIQQGRAALLSKVSDGMLDSLFDLPESFFDEAGKKRAHCSSSIKKILMGNVADRGGRADTMRPCKKDFMPSWKDRKNDDNRARARGQGKEYHGKERNQGKVKKGRDGPSKNK